MPKIKNDFDNIKNLADVNIVFINSLIYEAED